MKASILSLLIGLVLSMSLQAQASDKVLLDAYPGASNVRLIQFKDVRSAEVRRTLSEVDLAFEKGDGYFSVLTSALYMVFTNEGKLAGFMAAALMSYTQDPDLFLVAAYVNTKGERLGGVHDIGMYYGYEDEELKNLPKELQP